MASSKLKALKDVKINQGLCRAAAERKRCKELEGALGPSWKQWYISEVFANWTGHKILGINLSLSRLSLFYCLLALKAAKENPEFTFIFVPLTLAFSFLHSYL